MRLGGISIDDAGPAPAADAFGPGDGGAERALAVLEQAELGGSETLHAFWCLRDAYRSSVIEAERTRREMRRILESLVASEQMATLGGLMAGVAHEVSTPVGITLTAASHLAEQTETLREAAAQGRIRKSDFDEYVAVATEASQLILANARRAADLIQGFKQVAVDQTTSERRRFNLKRYLEEVMLSLSPRLRQAGHRRNGGGHPGDRPAWRKRAAGGRRQCRRDGALTRATGRGLFRRRGSPGIPRHALP